MERYKMRFKRFILESDEKDEETLNAIKLIEDLKDSIDIHPSDVLYNSKKSNSNRIVIGMYVNSSKRERYYHEVERILSSRNDIQMLTVGNSRQGKDLFFKYDKVMIPIYLLIKPRASSGGKKIDPNELMTAAVTMIPENLNPTTLEEIDAIIDNAKKLVPKNVNDYSESELNAFDGNYNNIAQAISASNAIKKWIGGIPDKAWMTGKRWGKEIS
jgi:hypothetical protein